MPIKPTKPAKAPQATKIKFKIKNVLVNGEPQLVLPNTTLRCQGGLQTGIATRPKKCPPSTHKREIRGSFVQMSLDRNTATFTLELDPGPFKPAPK